MTEIKSTASPNTLEPSTVVEMAGLVEVAPHAIVSRTLAKAAGGSVTVFAFDEGQALSEHTAPFEALVQMVEGELEITIAGEPHAVGPGEALLMPADVPHALTAKTPAKMMLVMLRGERGGE